MYHLKVNPALSKESAGLILSLFLLLDIGCGSNSETNLFDASVATEAPPIITRIDPTSARAGETVTIFGLGFSNGAPNNIVTVGGVSTSATAYGLVNPPAAGEIETLTFTVPTNATTGASSIFVTVFDNTGNTDVQLTINP